MSTSYWLDRSNEHPAREFDVVVVGAGISGLSTVYWLLKEDPALRIAVLERGRLGSGASGRNAGFITCGSVEHFNRLVGKHGLEEATAIWRFAEKNLELLQEHIIQAHGAEMQFEKKGCYSLAAQDSEFSELKKVAQMMESLKIPVSVHEANEIEKATGARKFVGGIKYLEDATIHPVQLLKKMRQHCQQIVRQRPEQLAFFEGVEVAGWSRGENDQRIVKTDAGSFSCSMVVLALNGFSPQLHPFFADKIYPTRGQILMMEPVERFMHGPCYANFYLDYFRQLPTGELLIGGFRQLEKATEVGYSDHITATIQDALHDFVSEHLPQFADKKVTHRWSGVMGFSQDGQPAVGAMPEDPQVFFLGGYTGHGIGLAFHTGRCLVDLIFGREVPKWLSAKRWS